MDDELHRSAVAGKTVASVRTDGLGQRLRALLTAMRISRKLGVDYVFTWQGEKLEHHAVPPATETFTKTYLDAHFRDPSALDHADVRAPVGSLDGLLKLAEGRSGWIISKGAALRGVSMGPPRPDDDNRTLFNEIGFSAPIRAAIQAADETPLPDDTAALHLRAGDIVYGRFRFGSRFTDKVIALPVARKLIDQLTVEGRTVVLFSQDPDTAALFRDHPQVIIAGDLAKRFETGVERAIFEIILMSRCGQIHAGSSAFALLAGYLTGIRVQDPTLFFSRSKMVKIIIRDLVRNRNGGVYPPLQTAFAAWVAADLTKKPDEAAAMLRLAIRYDPVNGYYWLRLAALYYGVKRDDRGDAVVRDMLTRQGPEADQARAIALHALNERRRGTTFMEKEQSIFIKAAMRGSDTARYLKAHIRDPRMPRPITDWRPLPDAAKT